MKLQDPVQAKEKRASGRRKAIVFSAIVVLGFAAGVFVGKIYFVREFVLFVLIAALVSLVAANLLVLGIVFYAAGQSILHSVRKAKPANSQQKEEKKRGANVVLPAETRLPNSV